MKSGKRRREEIRTKRLERAAKLHDLGLYALAKTLPVGAGVVAADPTQLAHCNTYGLLPVFYRDQPFVCRDCGSEEVWTAKQQKWWYEVAKGHIDSFAVRCRACRAVEKARIEEATRVSRKGMELKMAALRQKKERDGT
ncbi:MAG TPA: zinc-ribbon domain-containing protein [Polaromonas sp.]|jgi:hypothetical protein